MPLKSTVPLPAAPVKAAETASEPPKVYYYSPALSIDPTTGTTVLEIRDSTTGAITAQYPSEKDLKAYEEKSLKPETPVHTEAAQATPVTLAATAKPVTSQSVPEPDTAAPASASPQASILA